MKKPYVVAKWFSFDDLEFDPAFYTVYESEDERMGPYGSIWVGSVSRVDNLVLCADVYADDEHEAMELGIRVLSLRPWGDEPAA